jgi:hypothetical protein
MLQGQVRHAALRERVDASVPALDITTTSYRASMNRLELLARATTRD